MQQEIYPEVYATTTDPAAIHAMREIVTDQLEPCFDGRRDDHGRLYFVLQDWDGKHPCIRIGAKLVEFVGTQLAFYAIVPMPDSYTVQVATGHN
jgi:hypothetical protein